MSLLAEVTQVLDRAEVRYALIGAMAMATHGVSRSTQDIDLLAVDPSCLTESLWAPLRESGGTVAVSKGTWEDPLAGVVRCTRVRERPIDIVIGKFRWQREAIERATSARVGQLDLPVLGAADLILLKLYAGGPQDAWDIQQLLAVEARQELVREVEERLGDLRPESAAFWRKVLGDTVP
jgi:predicted nucleotidyltransferase